jgi:hypothetical protein
MEYSLSSLYLCTTCFSLTSLGANSQRCRCEPHHEETGFDCPSGLHLCYLCSIEVAGGLSRWSWEACDGCRKKNDLERRNGKAFYLLGRHSVMNGIALSMSEVRKREVNARVNQMVDFIGSMEDLRLAALARTEAMWRSVERWSAMSEIPVLEWQREFRPAPKRRNVRHGE